MELQQLGEFGLIDRIRKKWAAVYGFTLIQGIGDDVAVMDRGEKALLATTDILIEGVHFERSWMDPYSLGKKSLGVNLSDIAAMGGLPTYFLISLGIPRDLPLSFVTKFYQGIQEGARRFQVSLVGGDTSLSPNIVVNLCLLGEGKRKNLIFRKGARVGDSLFVSGTLGDSSLGLKILQQEGPGGKPGALIRKHLCPTPRVRLGQGLARHHLATAMIDVSDGLLSDTRHIMEESAVGALIWEDRLPLSPSYRKTIRTFSQNPYQMALQGGEDYELLFTAPPALSKKIASLSRALKIPITWIGKILPHREKLQVMKKDGSVYSPGVLGFDHFTSSLQPSRRG